jgi:hypothetical protein
MATSGAADVLDVISTHQFAVAMRNGSWELIETRSPDLEEVHTLLDIAEHGRRADINKSVQGRDRRSQGVQSWKQLYRAAVLETNMKLVPRRIREARKAAGERAVHLIREASDDEPELQDLIYASVVLNELSRRCQSGRR